MFHANSEDFTYDEMCGPRNIVHRQTNEWVEDPLLQAVEIHAFFTNRLIDWDEIW